MEEVNKTEAETKPLDKRDTVDFWRKWIVSAKRISDEHFKLAKEAWSEFEAKDTGDNYPIYWSSVKTIETAYYSRTPQTTNRRRFDVDDDDAAVACLINKRLADYLVENANFDAVMMAAVGDYIHADKATTQVIYEAEFEEVALYLGDPTLGQLDVDEQGEMLYYDEMGQQFEGEVFERGDSMYGKRAIESTQKIYLAPLLYREILHTPEAKTQAEIKEMAFKFIKTRQEAESFFPDVDLSSVQWRKSRSAQEDRRRDRIEVGEEYIEGWEIYSDPNKMVYWYSEQYREGFLKKENDPQGFRNFFPCPAFIIGTKPSESLYPVPVYKRLKPQIETLTKQSDKIYELMDAIDARALVDSSVKEVLELMNEGSGRYIGITNFQSIVEKGNLSALVQYLPTAELVNSLTTFLQANDSFKNDFYEHFGLPDVLRGVSDQVSTATEQTLTASAGHDRFRFQKKQVRQLARDSIEMMLDLAYKVFSNEKIARITGAQFMEEDQRARFGNALAILKDDETRLIRIDIETDSMSFVDEQLRSQQTAQAVETFITGLKNVSQTAKEDLPLARASLQALLESLESLGAPGQAFLESAKKTLEKIISDAEEAAKNPQEPPIDPKIEIEQRKCALEEAKFQFEQQKEVTNQQLAIRDQNLEEAKQMFQQQLDSALLQLQQVAEQFNEFKESELLKLEQFKVQLDEREKFIEEQRLAYESQIESIRVQMQTPQQPQEPQPPMIIQVPAAQMPPINLNVDASKSGRRRATLIENPLTGETEIVSEDIISDPIIGGI